MCSSLHTLQENEFDRGLHGRLHNVLRCKNPSCAWPSRIPVPNAPCLEAPQTPKVSKARNRLIIGQYTFWDTAALQVLQWFETSLHAWLSALAISKRMDAASVATSAERLRSGLRSLRLYTRNWADLTGSKRDALELLGWVISSCLTSVPHLRTLIFESETKQHRVWKG